MSSSTKKYSKQHRQYVKQLEQANYTLTIENMQLQLKIATLMNQLWEQSLKFDPSKQCPEDNRVPLDLIEPR